MRSDVRGLQWRGLLRTAARVAYLCAALACGGVAAQTSSPPDAVRDLVLAGDLQGAKDVLLAWSPATPDEEAQRLWLLAVVHREAGQPAQALAALEALVARKPDVARFRFELAETLAKLGQRERAAYHYDLARGGPLTPAQRDHAAAQARSMETPSPWSGSLGIALVPSSNPTRKTQAETIDLGFGEAVLAPSSRADPATGLAIQGGLAYAHQVSDRLQMQVGLNLDGEFYEGTAPDDVTGKVDASVIALAGPNTLLRASVSYQERYVDGAVYARGQGVSASAITRQGASGRLSFGVAFTDLTHPTSPGSDGLRSVAYLSYTHALSSTSSLRGSVKYERTDAASPEIAASVWEIGLGASHVFAGGLTIDGDLRVRTSTYDGPHGLFGVVEHTRRETLSVQMRHSEVSWGGFAPYVEVVAERQHSNIPVSSYDAFDVGFGLTRRF